MTKNLEFRDNLKKFVLDVLEKNKLTPSELCRITGCHETTWDRFLRDEIYMPGSKTVVAFADYVKAPLDKIFGRDLVKEIELETLKIPAFMTGLSTEALQSVMHVKEEARKFRHKSMPSPNDPKKSFVEQEKARRANKQPTEKSR